MATPFACDRCLTPVMLSPTGAGDTRPSISLRMPHNPTTGMSEGLDFNLCASCYALVREFMGLEPNQSLIDGWKARELVRSRQLPTLTYRRAINGPATRKADKSNDNR